MFVSILDILKSEKKSWIGLRIHITIYGPISRHLNIDDLSQSTVCLYIKMYSKATEEPAVKAEPQVRASNGQLMTVSK